MSYPSTSVTTRRKRLATLKYRRAMEATDVSLRRETDNRGARVEALAQLTTFTRMNRMSGYFEKPPEGEYGDFFVVAGEFGAACVSSETATQIEAMLDRKHVPKWIVFDDRSGSRIRVRSRHIHVIEESTVAQRATDRLFARARKREEQEDRRPWDD
jgi:hypothetical protein